jgi:hypothetical protein
MEIPPGGILKAPFHISHKKSGRFLLRTGISGHKPQAGRRPGAGFSPGGGRK